MTYAVANITANGIRSPVLQTSAASNGWSAAWRSGMPSTRITNDGQVYVVSDRRDFRLT
jgi:hypothetical protein